MEVEIYKKNTVPLDVMRCSMV